MLVYHDKKLDVLLEGAESYFFYKVKQFQVISVCWCCIEYELDDV